MSKPPYKSNGPKRPGTPRNGSAAGTRGGKVRDDASRGRADERRTGRDERVARTRDDERTPRGPARGNARNDSRGDTRGDSRTDSRGDQSRSRDGARSDTRRAGPADRYASGSDRPARFGDKRRARDDQQRSDRQRGAFPRDDERRSGASRSAPMRSDHTPRSDPAPRGERPYRDERPRRDERPYREDSRSSRPFAERTRSSGERPSRDSIANEQGSSERPWAEHRPADVRFGDRRGREARAHETRGNDRREGSRPPRRDGEAPRKAYADRQDHAGRSDTARRDAPQSGFARDTPRQSTNLRGAGSAYAKPYRESAARPSVRPDLRTAPHKTMRPTGPTPKDPNLPEREGERIAKLLARAGIASRRDAERLIAEGRVKRGDEVIVAPSTVLLDLTGVTVDDQPVGAPEATRLFVFHKPAGLLTAERDPMGRPTIYTALRNALPEGTGRVIPVGRLDYNTEGLLLLTNDGAFKRQLELPSSAVPRTYRARAFGDITQPQLEALIEGIEIDGVHYGKIDANMERRTGRNQWIEMTLTEGKNREVRRVLEHLGLEVSRLLRVAYGPFVLADLPKGLAYEVPTAALERFRGSLETGK